MQIEEKRKMNDFERTLDSEQARIWKTDTNRFYEQEKNINAMVNLFNYVQVRGNNTVNAGYLMNQIDFKRSKFNTKMNDQEYALNRKILENIKIGGPSH